MSQPRERKEHLFSPHTNMCIYCGKSATDDAIENTECGAAESVSCAACAGRGWLFTNTGNDQSPRHEIQRCDACGKYQSDIAALEAVVKIAETQPGLLQFVQEVSLLMHEGEPDEAGESFERTSEDAIATLNQLILQARQLLGTAEKCSECGETVAYVIGCPDGAEVCQDCFDAGQH